MSEQNFNQCQSLSNTFIDLNGSKLYVIFYEHNNKEAVPPFVAQ